MNTMKKEDMEKEQKDLLMNIGVAVVRAGMHVTRLLGAIGRVDFLVQEIAKVTPVPEVKKEEPNA